MSLTASDFDQITAIVNDVVYGAIYSTVPAMIEAGIAPLRDEVMALRADVKEIYNRLDSLDRRTTRLEQRVDQIQAA